ncbi:MAG TPA: hypothetical protein VLG46_05670 [Anaerolineae bacterium]|nr:hypothetical protein [Anaerolineae bacterium]
MNLFYLLTVPVLLYFIWTAWRIFPALVFAFNPTGGQYQFIDMSDEDLSSRAANRISEILSQLQQLGFRRLGTKSEKSSRWSDTLYEFSLANPDLHAFASLVKDPKRCVYYFYTPFTDGTILLTAGKGAAFPTIQRQDCVQRVSAYDNPDRVLADHQEQLQRFTAIGLAPFYSYTQESRLEATRQYYAAPAIQHLAHRLGILGVIYLLFPLLLIAVLLFLGSRG